MSESETRCVLCGEVMLFDEWGTPTTGEVAEAHGEPKPLFGTTDISTTSGLVHAQCMDEAGWEIS